MNLRERAVDLTELMDDPDCDPHRLAATYRRFGTVNRLISGWGAVYRRSLRPFLRGLGRPARVLDLGSGGGDLVQRLSRLAERDGIDAEWVGAEPEPRALRAAAWRRSDRIRFVPGDSGDLRAAGERFDAVISNHVLHHLGAEELRSFADDSLALSSGPVLHADIERSRLAYGLYAAGITPLRRGTFLYVDGLRSIRRSYRAGELGQALGGEWRVCRPAPFRLLAMGHGHA
jgi:2-polyprenyl-3-methyl-5-hydroxy-6-metoxy-1,4-benzoquinol methylase